MLAASATAGAGLVLGVGGEPKLTSLQSLEARASAAAEALADRHNRERELEDALRQLESKLRELRDRNERLESEVGQARAVKEHVYLATNHTRKPKHKVSVVLETAAGKTYEGNFFISGDQRIKDLLNGAETFLPLETAGGDIYLINRSSISEVVPRHDRASPAAAPPSIPAARSI